MKKDVQAAIISQPHMNYHLQSHSSCLAVETEKTQGKNSITTYSAGARKSHVMTPTVLSNASFER